MLGLIKKFWHRLRDWISQLLTPHLSRDRRTSRRTVESLKPLSDTDYEFVFSQLLDGVAHGWHEGRILKFFEQLGDRGKARNWVPWLERFGETVLASTAPNLQLAERLLRLGSMAQSFPQTAPIGEVAYGIGRQLYSREAGATIWEYTGDDESIDFKDNNREDRISSLPVDTESETISLEELFDRLQQDPDFRENLAAQFGVSSADPQAIIDTLVGRFQEAHDQFENQPLPETAEAWLERGIQQSNYGDLEGAIASWDKALGLNPDLTAAWQNRGNVLGMLGRWDEAIASIDHAIAIASEDANVWFAKGSLCANIGQWDDSIAAWDRAITLQPENSYAWHNRGYVLEQLGQTHEAIAAYQRALVIDPKLAASRDRLNELQPPPPNTFA
jgi:tetratricopeptide (TPR) repeat protein